MPYPTYMLTAEFIAWDDKDIEDIQTSLSMIAENNGYTFIGTVVEVSSFEDRERWADMGHDIEDIDRQYLGKPGGERFPNG